MHTTRVCFCVLFVVLAFATVCQARSNVHRQWKHKDKSGNQENFPQACCDEKPKNVNNTECCKIPKEELWKGWESALNACRIAIDTAAQKEGQIPVSTTAEPNPSENETDSEESDDEDEDEENLDEPQDSKPIETTTTARSGRKHCKKRGSHRSRGRAIKCAMEKMGWSKDNKLDYEKFAQDTGKDITEPSEDLQKWIDAAKEVIGNCSVKAKQREEHEKRKGKHHEGHHKAKFTPEAEAMHCIKKSLKYHCPKYNDEIDYCAAKRKFKEECGLKGRRLHTQRKKHCTNATDSNKT